MTFQSAIIIINSVFFSLFPSFRLHYFSPRRGYRRVTSHSSSMAPKRSGNGRPSDPGGYQHPGMAQGKGDPVSSNHLNSAMSYEFMQVNAYERMSAGEFMQGNACRWMHTNAWRWMHCIPMHVNPCVCMQIHYNASECD